MLTLLVFHQDNGPPLDIIEGGRTLEQGLNKLKVLEGVQVLHFWFFKFYLS